MMLFHSKILINYFPKKMSYDPNFYTLLFQLKLYFFLSILCFFYCIKCLYLRRIFLFLILCLFHEFLGGRFHILLCFLMGHDRKQKFSHFLTIYTMSSVLRLLRLFWLVLLIRID